MDDPSRNDHSEEQVASNPSPSTDMPDTHPGLSAEQDIDTEGSPTKLVDSSPLIAEDMAKKESSDSEKTIGMEQTDSVTEQPDATTTEGRPSVSDISRTSDSAASTPFGTPENRDHPLPEVSGDGKLEESPDIVTSLRSSPTPRTIDLSNVAATTPHGSSHPSVFGLELTRSKHVPDNSNSDSINSLKAQLEALSEQRDMLNQKLVTSFSRMADLEDDLFQIRDTTNAQKRQIDELERERKEHLHALDTGLLVEQSNVKQEMQRLAASLMDEQGKRDLAEEGKHKVESEVDDLAASLFQQANSMVAAERLARARAEARLVTAEENLSVAESVVREMQSAMQTLSLSSGTASAPAKSDPGSVKANPLFRNDHIPYTEFLAFITHLRSMRPRTHSSALPFTSLLQFINMAFLARMITEDHEPALRLDFAPGVSWLNKKSISQAVIDSMLIVEPVSAVQVFSQKPEGDIVCALSGELISPASANPLLTNSESSSATFAAPLQTRGLSFFNRGTTARSIPPVVRSGSSQPGSISTASHPPIYVFHIAPAVSQTPSEKPTSLFPVAEGWSLDRLRATCELWRFVKTGILNAVWNYEDGTTPIGPPKLPARSERVSQIESAPLKVSEVIKPALPPRKSNSWGLNLGFSKSSGPSSGGWGLQKSQPSTPKEEESNKKLTEAPKIPARRIPPPLASTKVQDIEPKEGSTNDISTAPDQTSTGEPSAPSADETKTINLESHPVEPVAESDKEGESQIEKIEGKTEETLVSSSVIESAHGPEPIEVVKPDNTHEASVDHEESNPEGGDGLPSTVQIPVEKVEESESSRASLEKTDSNRASLEQTSLPQPEVSTTGNAPPLPKRAAARRAVPPVPISTAASEAGTRPTTPVPTSADGIKEDLPANTTLSSSVVSSEPLEIIEIPNGSGEPDQTTDISTSEADPNLTSSVSSLPNDDSKKEEGPEPAVVIPVPLLSSEKTEDKADAEEIVPVKEDSWEERTWKELVKLREDLFWKRIGVRPSNN